MRVAGRVLVLCLASGCGPRVTPAEATAAPDSVDATAGEVDVDTIGSGPATGASAAGVESIPPPALPPSCEGRDVDPERWRSAGTCAETAERAELLALYECRSVANERAFFAAAVAAGYAIVEVDGFAGRVVLADGSGRFFEAIRRYDFRDTKPHFVCGCPTGRGGALTRPGPAYPTAHPPEGISGRVDVHFAAWPFGPRYTGPVCVPPP